MRKVNPSRLANARHLRRRMTDAERKLWRYLRRRELSGAKFRRQVTVGPYIVDFLCKEQKLIIEVDGGQHASSVRDGRRDRFLELAGYRIVRFWNHEVLQNTEGVLQTIADALSEEMLPPHPNPLPAGERESR